MHHGRFIASICILNYYNIFFVFCQEHTRETPAKDEYYINFRPFEKNIKKYQKNFKKGLDKIKIFCYNITVVKNNSLI